MIERIGAALKFLAFYTSFRRGKIALIVTADVYSPAGKIISDAMAAEVGGGMYSYTLPGNLVPTAGEYICVFKTEDDSVDQQEIPGLWVVGRGGIENLDAPLSGVMSQLQGNGAREWTYTLTLDGSEVPMPDAMIWVTSDSTGNNIVASGRTDQFGKVTFFLDPGTVYVWAKKSGYNFNNPDTEVVS